MYRPRSIDDLVQDPEFLASDECKDFQELVDQGAYPSVKDAILSIVRAVDTARREDWASWPEQIAAAIESEKKG